MAQIRVMFEDITTAWKAGDLDKLEEQLNSAMKEYPDLERKFLTDRNQAWLPRIEQYLKGTEDVLVVIHRAYAKHAQVKLQLAGYISTLNYFDPAKGWKSGTTYQPPSRLYLSALAWAVVYQPRNGVIMYDVIDVPSLVLVGAATVATVWKADIALTTGLATINSLLGKF